MGPSHAVRFASLTDVGVRRSHNQDACACQPAPDEARWQSHGHVFIVADGMGGHAVGEKASAKAIRDVPLTFLKHVATDGPAAAVRRAFTEANAAIHAIGQNNPEFKGLGTTGTALFLRPEGAWVGHVGDSRAYRVRGNRVQQLTFDHSWVWEVARRQGIDPDELGDFKRNVIIRSLGPDVEVEVDVEGPHPVEPGDVFLLCSDGLSNLIPPDELGAVVTTFPPEEACQYLVALANARGGPDNITCLIVEVPGGAPKGTDAAVRPGLWARLGRAAAGVNRVVPWPFLSLIVGAGLAGLSVWLRSEELPGAVGSFLVATVLILAGLVGLYFHLRRQSEETEADHPEGEQELRLYRDYEFTIGEPLVTRFAELEASLRVSVPDLGPDTARFDQLAAAAKAAADKGEWRAAFRARFEAVQLLANVFNKTRQKDEAFTPNWTTPTRAANG